MTQAIERAAPRNLALDMWGAERLEVLRQQIAPGASDAELDLFAEVCSRTRLSPFANQIWSIPRRRKVKDERGRESWETYRVIQIGVHGLRLIAQRSKEFAGEKGPYWCGEDGEWIDVWLHKEPPVAARVGVDRKGFKDTLWSVAVWERAAQFYQPEHGSRQPMALWATRGPEQLALAAERDALRRAFPVETSGIEAVLDDQERAAAQRYSEIYAREDDVVIAGDHFVDRQTGEVVVPQRDQAQAIVERAHAAAAQRDEDLDAIEAARQREQEGLL